MNYETFLEELNASNEKKLAEMNKIDEAIANLYEEKLSLAGKYEKAERKLFEEFEDFKLKETEEIE